MRVAVSFERTRSPLKIHLHALLIFLSNRFRSTSRTCCPRWSASFRRACRRACRAASACAKTPSSG
jgi:hypothetical protein